MPKTLKTPKKRLLYTEEAMRQALEDVSNGLSIREASRIHNVPRSTLFGKWKGDFQEGRKIGALGVLSPEEEKALEDWVLSCAEKGHPVTKDQLLDSVQLLCKKLKIPNNFVKGRPGRSWYEGYMKRHPTLSMRTSENMSSTRANVSQEELSRWFSDVRGYLQEKGLLNLPPSRIFNCDESAFFLSPDDNKVIAKRGSRVVPSIINSGEKECLTTLLMIAANGDLAPPIGLLLTYTGRLAHPSHSPSSGCDRDVSFLRNYTHTATGGSSSKLLIGLLLGHNAHWATGGHFSKPLIEPRDVSEHSSGSLACWKSSLKSNMRLRLEYCYAVVPTQACGSKSDKKLFHFSCGGKFRALVNFHNLNLVRVHEFKSVRAYDGFLKYGI